MLHVTMPCHYASVNCKIWHTFLYFCLMPCHYASENLLKVDS
uniref:Uncharacterized protein n=1 Tax=Arundo donax TaxID=35708 RepID=A0A0A9CQQ9_ARUDO